MLTKERAIELGSAWGRAELYHLTLTNADGSALRARVNGKCRTWKRDESRWELPVKHGLRDCGYISPDGPTHMHPAQWTEVEPIHAKELARMAKVVGLSADCPLPILADALRDAGHGWQADRLLAHLNAVATV